MKDESTPEDGSREEFGLFAIQHSSFRWKIVSQINTRENAMVALYCRLAVLSVVSAAMLAAGPACAGAPGTDGPKQTLSYPPGWKAACQRDEIRPTFSFEPKGGPKGKGAFVLAAAD